MTAQKGRDFVLPAHDGIMQVYVLDWLLGSSHGFHVKLYN